VSRRISHRRAVVRLYRRWLAFSALNPALRLALRDVLSRENVEAVAALDLYPEWDGEIEERELGMLLARAAPRPDGRLQ
jgi:hypothetical protein